MILEIGERGVRNGVDGVGPDQGVDVERVGVVGVLRRGGRPQRALHPSAACDERLPAGPTERLEEHLVGDTGVGHRRSALQRQRLRRANSPQTPINLRVDPRDEKRGDRGDRSEIAGMRLEALEVTLDDLGVPVDGEQQCHVHADALGDGRGDGRKTFSRAGDLHQQVRGVDHLVEVAGCGDGAVGVMGKAGGHLDGHEPVGTAA